MAAFSSFYQWVLPYAAGCPNPSVDIALRDAAREFCRRSSAWRNQAAAQTGDGTTQAFTFVFPTGAELVKVLRCTVGGEDMDILSSREMPADWQETSPETDALQDCLVVKADNAGCVIYPPPADGDDIVIYQALMPTISASTLGDVLYTDYGEQVAQGAIARLCTLPGQSWTNLQQADISMRAFERAINSAANRISRQGRLRTALTPI